MNKIALVTGSSRGIGAATARKLALKGYSVCINYIKDTDSALKVVDQIEKMGGPAIPVQADVSEEKEVEKLFTTTDDKLGRINVLINNAGILFTQMNIDTMSAERINRTLKTNNSLVSLRSVKLYHWFIYRSFWRQISPAGV